MSIVFTGIRFAANSLTQIGAGIIVKNVVKATTPEDVSKFSKVAIAFGSYGISAVVGVAAAKQVDDLIKVIPTSFKKGTKIGKNLVEEPEKKTVEEVLREIFGDEFEAWKAKNKAHVEKLDEDPIKNSGAYKQMLEDDEPTEDVSK